MSALKRLGAIVGGMLVAFGVIVLLEMAGHAIFPLPDGMHDASPEQVKALLAGMPVGALLLVVLGWAAGALAGGLVAALVGQQLRPAIVVGVVLLVATVATFVSIPHPLWMMIAGVVLPVPLALLGAKLGMRLRPS